MGKNFGIPGETKSQCFERIPTTGLFDEEALIDALGKAMDDLISHCGPQNVPKCLKLVEIMGIMQARQWEINTLDDFREFFAMKWHATFESVTKSEDIQNALRDLYEHPDKIELYPGVFCESDERKGLDPGSSDTDSALWYAIFSDAITLVRSDRFYTPDWNTKSLISWGMKEVTPDNDTCKSSFFHRGIQRGFPKQYHYDPIQFFHSFYTRQTNAKYAAAPEIRMEVNKDGTFDVIASKSRKPVKLVYIADTNKIVTVLDNSSNFAHPALTPESYLPKCPHELLKIYEATKEAATQGVVKEATKQTPIEEDVAAIVACFDQQMKDIVTWESTTMNTSIPQIDATRE